MNKTKKKKTIFNNKTRREQFVLYWALLLIPLVQFVLMYICVNFRSILFSFQKYDFDTAEYVFNFIFFKDNLITILRELFSGETLGIAWWNSTKSYLLTLLIIMPIQIIVAFFIYKKMWFSKFLQIVLYFPNMIAGMTTIIAFKYFVEKGLPNIFPTVEIFRKLGGLLANNDTIFNTLLFYVFWTSLGGGMIMMTGQMSRIDKEVLEAAQIDGVNIFQEFIHIAFPVIYPILIIQLYTRIIAIFTGGPPLYQFFASNVPSQAQTIQYYFFTLIIGSTSSPANFPKAALGGVLFTIVAAPIVFTLKWVLERLDPNR